MGSTLIIIKIIIIIIIIFIIIIEGTRKFIAVKFPRHCPVVLLVKVGWRQDRSAGMRRREGNLKWTLESMQHKKIELLG
jgi:hypothetical protein